MTAQSHFTAAAAPNWRDAQYHVEEAGKSFYIACFATDPIARDWHVQWGMDKFREAIEAIGPETLGYQRIDRIQAAAVICGVEAPVGNEWEPGVPR